MAKGFTDWDVPVNINAQTLGEIINRPKYGAAQQVTFDDPVTANGNTELLSISGTGKIYGGVVFASASASSKGSTPSVSIDNRGFIMQSYEDMFNKQFISEQMNYFFLTMFDDIDFNYSVGLSNDYTFETDFKLFFTRHFGILTDVLAVVNFALI